MALIIGGATMSGKVGNKVYMKTGSVRAYAIPTNPASTPQANIRAMISAFSTVFRSFTPAQQSAWADAAKNFPRHNRVGEKYDLAGMNFFTSCAMVAQILINGGCEPASPDATNPPSPATITKTEVTTLKVTATYVLFGMSEVPQPEEFLMVFLTPPLSTGINFTRRSRYRLIACVKSDDFSGLDVDITSQYEEVFGTLPAPGTKVFLEAYIVRRLEWIKRPAGKAADINPA